MLHILLNPVGMSMLVTHTDLSILDFETVFRLVLNSADLCKMSLRCLQKSEIIFNQYDFIINNLSI